jgi:hypothetical protein
MMGNATFPAVFTVTADIPVTGNHTGVSPAKTLSTVYSTVTVFPAGKT